MKLKRILAGALAAAMVLASVPATGLNASAAEYAQITITEDNVRANSEMNPVASNNEDGPAWYAFNNNESNWWHSRWGGTVLEGEVSSGLVSESNPIWIEAGFGAEKNVSRLAYKRRSNGYGNVNKYDILVADMGTSTEKPVDTDFVVIKSGNLQNTGDLQNIDFPAVQATHIRLKVYSIYANGGENYVAASRIDIYEDSSATNPAQIKDISASVKTGCESMGNVTASASKMAEGISTVTLTATPANINYKFVQWADAEGNRVSTDAVYTTSIAGAYTAEFAEETVTQLTISNSNSNSWMGGMGASNAFTLDDNTKWSGNTGETNTSTGNMSGTPSATNKVYIQGGFDSEKNLKKLTYKVSSTSTDHCIKDYEILVANSSETNPPASAFVKVMEGTFAQTTADQVITLPYPVAATHFRLQATSSYGDTYVVATYIAAYEQTDASGETKNIVSLTDKATVAEEGAGSISMMPSVGISGEDVVVTLRATAADGHYFVRWTDENGATVGSDSNIQVTVNSTGTKVYTANFAVGADPYYKESAYWDKEEAGDTISTQDENDIWYYQIKNVDGWSNIDSQYYYPTSEDNDNFGRWLQNGSGQNDTFFYGKISKEQLTTNFANTGYEAVGYAWKAGAKGYYSAALESAVGAGNGVALHVSHASKDALTADGKELYTGTMSQGSTIDNCRIAKAEAGDYIRIYGTKSNTWVTGFKPMIVPRTAKEYATQYLGDLAAQNINTEDYTTETAEAYTTAKTDLEGAIAEGMTATEDDITAKIEALEAAVAGLKEKVKFTGTTLTLDGKIGLTFYTNLTSLDGVTAASFTVDGTKTVDAVYELKNGYVACTYKLAAKEMTDEVSASITVNGETITSAETSAASNANALLNDTNSSDTLKALAKSLLNYGAAAQAQFGYNEANPANASLSDTDKAVAEIGTELDTACAGMGVTADCYKGLSLVLNSETALKLYATGDTSITLKQGENVVASSGEEKNNGFSFVKVENIAANHLQDTYTVVINNNEDTTYTVSPLLYCYNVAKGEGFDANLKNLVNALYDYNQKAIAYGNSQN